LERKDRSMRARFDVLQRKEEARHRATTGQDSNEI